MDHLSACGLVHDKTFQHESNEYDMLRLSLGRRRILDLRVEQLVEPNLSMDMNLPYLSWNLRLSRDLDNTDWLGELTEAIYCGGVQREEAIFMMIDYTN